MDQWTDRSGGSGGYNLVDLETVILLDLRIDRVMKNGRIDSVVDWCTDRLIYW